MSSELKAVVVNESTGEIEYIDVEDFVDTSGVAQEVEIVTVDEFRQFRQIPREQNLASSGFTSTTQSITKPIAAASGSPFHYLSGGGGNLRSTPSLLRNSRQPSSARSHGHAGASSQFLQVQNSRSFYIPVVQQEPTGSSSPFHQLVDPPAILPPASAQFIRAVEATASAGASTEGGTQLIVFNGETSNFDVIPQDGNQNLQLRLCQVVNEDVDDDGHGNINTIYICEEQPSFGQDTNEYPNIQIVEELPMPILQDADGNVYEVEEFHHHAGHSQSNEMTLSFQSKRRKKSGKSTPSSSRTSKDNAGKAPKRPVNELKCLEIGCGFAGVNVSELRKHLTSVHFKTFDEEVIHFTSDKEFKIWRESYERERMVSFIFRGGTKKISRDQAVTYLICHRSGHYKPTMKDQSLRKRKMKPQGSCKMNGYCTAGIKLLKNLESGDVRCEICHTHYGHPLDSGAIPHLRVNNMLRKIIWKKFEEGMSFNQVVRYLHHNPDQLEGLRLLDRRAVRNIYDKFKKNPGKGFLDEDYDNDTMSPSKEEEEEEDKLAPPTLLKFDCEIIIPFPSSPSTSSAGGRVDLEPPVLEKIQCDNVDELINEVSSGRSSHVNEPMICDDVTAATTTTTILATGSPTNAKIESSVSEDENDDDDNWNPPASLKPKRSAKTKKTGGRMTSKSSTIRLYSSPSSSTETKVEGGVQKTISHNNTNSLPFHIQDCISEEVKSQIANLLDHGDAGPTVLMYKKFGIMVPEYGPKDHRFHKEDFCLVIQTPVQRELMKEFSDVVYIDGHKGRQKDLKLMFVMVLDEFREAIPVAWLISNATDDRMVSIFLKVLRDHCGDIQSWYLMAPINSNYCQIWSAVFCFKDQLAEEDEATITIDQQPPQMILNEEDTKRDMRIEVAESFSDSTTRKKLNGLMHNMMYAVDQNSMDAIYTEMKEYLESAHGDKGKDFLSNFEKNWLTKAQQWSLIYRIGSPVNTLYVSESFGKLKKFIAFKGTKILSSVIDPVLKIGYDKCFSRSKRLCKGDQKLMKTLDDIAMYHQWSTLIPSECLQPKVTICTTITDDGNTQSEQEIVDDNAWLVIDQEKDAEYTVIDIKSHCRCRFICTLCDVCLHKYMCSCPLSQVDHQMCVHIHFVHSQLKFRDKKIKWIPVSTTGHVDGEMETIVIEAIQEADDTSSTFRENILL